MTFTCHFCTQTLTRQFLAGTTTRFYACHPCQEKLIQAEHANQYWTKHNQAFKKKLWEKIKLQYPSLAKEIDYHLIKGECSFSQSIICDKI